LIIAGTFFLSANFILAADRLYGPSQKGGYQLGLLLVGRMHEVDWHLLRDDLLSWAIRGFFLPINFCELVWTIAAIRGHELSFLSGPWVTSEYYLLLMIYALIIAAVAPGYLFGARLIRTETKAISSSWFAWTVTLACYSPFETAFFINWFDYNPSTPDPFWLQPWVAHLESVPLLLALVGVVILVFSLIHLWAEAQFGIRSSNLSNRGIITTGAYRFCKHPVYASKCVVWLLIWMPFLSGVNILDDLRLTVLWACVCGIYMLRSLAEEKLLANDPAYVAYALWIDEHGMFKTLGKICPPLSFSWRLAYWQRTA
jgi:protein-S-isoprenylcysteine O-methyltransferase Ste14